MATELIDPPFSALSSLPAASAGVDPHHVPRWSATFLAAASVGTMWSLQLHLRVIGDRIGSTSTGDGIADLSVASSMLYVGKLVGSFVVLFGFPDAVQQPGRAAIGFVVAAAAQLTIAAAYFGGSEDSSPWTVSLAPLTVACFATGLARCVTESVIFSYVGFFGARTKPWIVAGFAVGFQLTGVVAYSLYAWFGATVFIVRVVFLSVAAASACAGGVVLWLLPKKTQEGIPMSAVVPFETKAESWRHACEWRRWLPLVREHCAYIAAATFVSSLVSGIVQFVYVNRDGLELLPDVTTSPNAFMALFSLVGFVAAVFASSVFRSVQRPLMLGSLACLVSLLFAASRIAILATLSGGASYFAYVVFSGTGSVDIDKRVDPEHNLITTTVWLAFTCFGCVAGIASSGPISWLLLSL